MDLEEKNPGAARSRLESIVKTDPANASALMALARLAPLIAAIGISFILQGVGIYWKGSTTILPPALIPTDARSINILSGKVRE